MNPLRITAPVLLALLLPAALRAADSGPVPVSKDPAPAASSEVVTPPILRLDEVRPGMKGVGRTVFRGTQIEEFPVTVLSVVRNAGPKQDFILAEGGGDVLAESGIQQGMSGSPVYVEGRLVGACAFAFSFSKRALMGITPIEYMLEIPERGSARPGAAERATLPPRLTLHDFREPAASGRAPDGSPEPFFVGRLRRRLQGGGPEGMVPIGLPLAAGGFSGPTLDRLTPMLASLGMTPAVTGSVPPAMAPDAQLVPGAPIGATLVRGDVTLDAFGTVTWASGGRVLGFGHPFFNLGNVDFPMATGYVHAVVPRSSMSFKMASPVRQVGAVRQDRSVGIFGVMGGESRMLPVRVTLRRDARRDAEEAGDSTTSAPPRERPGREDGKRTAKTSEADDSTPAGKRGSPDVQEFHFEVIHDPNLAPVLTLVALSQIFSSVEKEGGETTLRLLDTSRIEVDGYPEVLLGDLFSGEGAAFNASAYVGTYLAYLLGNEFEDPEITAIHLDVEYAETPREAELRRVYFDRKTVEPGDTVLVRAFLQPRRLDSEYTDIRIRIPDEIEEGKLVLSIGDAASITALEVPQGDIPFRGLDQLIELLNSLRTSDGLYVTLGRPQESLLIGGKSFPNLPPSAAAILRSDLVRGPLSSMALSNLGEESVRTPYVVSGYEKITLEVKNGE